MPFRKNSYFKTTQISVIFIIAAIALCVVVIAGWVFQFHILTFFIPGWSSMKLNLGLALIFSGFSLFCFTKGINYRLAMFIAFMVFLLGIITISEYVFSWNGYIVDELLLVDNHTAPDQNPGRMSPASSVAILMIGISLLSYNSKKKIYRLFSKISSSFALIIALVSLIGFLYGADQLYKLPGFVSISIPAAFSIALLSAGIFLTKPDEGFLASFNKPTQAASTGWRGALFIIILLFIISWLELQGEHIGLNDSEFGSAMMIILFAMSILYVIWWRTKKLNIAEEESERLFRLMEESENNLRQVTDNSTEMIWSMDKEHRLIIFNKAFYDDYNFITGTPPKAGIIHYKVFKQEDEAFWKQKINEALAGKKLSFEYSYEIAGQARNIEVFLYPINKNNSITGVTCFVINITDRKKAERALRESDANLREAQRIAQIGSWELDLVNNLLLWSDEIYRIFEIAPGQFGASYEAFLNSIHPEDREMVNEAYAGSLKNRIPYDIVHRLLLPGGRIKYVREQCETFYDEAGKPLRSLGTVQDITKYRIAEDKIRESEARYRTLMEKAGDSIVLFDREGNIIEANESAFHLLGYTGPEFRKIMLKYIVEEDDLKKMPLQFDLLDKGESTITYRRLKRKDGSIVELEIHAKKIADDYYIAVGRDITERKKAEDAIKHQSEQLRQLTAHLQTIQEEERKRIGREIHDELGQQLTVMMMDVGWLDKKIDAENNQAKMRIKELMQMLEAMVMSVRRISSELRPSILDDLGLVAAMEMHLKEFAKRSGIDIQLRMPQSELKLSDQVKNALFRIFQESLTNVARHSKAKHVKVKLEQKDEKIFLKIVDDGIGFDERKVTIKRTLGVLGMKERAVGIGGEYFISGEEGKGTTILVTVPYITGP